MTAQVNWKIHVYDKGLTREEILDLAGQPVQKALHEAVMKELSFLFPELRERMQIGLSTSEVTFLLPTLAK